MLNGSPPTRWPANVFPFAVQRAEVDWTIATLRETFRLLYRILVQLEKPTENLVHDFNYAFRILQHEAAHVTYQ